MPRHTAAYRGLPLIAVTTVLVTALAACSTTSKDSTGSAPSSGATSGGSGTTLTVDTSFIIQSMDPDRNVTPTLSVIESGVYQTLLKLSADTHEPQPALASDFKASDDAKTYTFTLDTKAKFSDGSPVTSADVLFSFNRLKNIKAGGSYLTDGLTFSAPDDHTFVVASKTPNPAIPAIIATPAFVILNSASVKAAGGTDAEDAAKSDKADAWFASNSAGSGPYVLSSYRTNDSVVLERNKNYWGAQAPKFDRVVLRNMPAATQMLNVVKGKNEVALDLSADQGSGLKGKDAVTVTTTPSPSVFRLQLNMNPGASKVTSNEHIRNAIRYGVNYDAITQLGGAGSARAAGLLPSAIPGSLPVDSAIATDAAKAKQELAASGIANPKITLTYPSDIDVNGIKFDVFAQRAKADLESIGLGVKLKGEPVSTYLQEWRTLKMEATVTYSYPDYVDSSSLLSYLPGGSDGARAGWAKGADPTLEAAGAKLGSTADPATRAQLATDIQKTLQTAGPYVTLVQPSQTVVSSANLVGVALDPSFTIDVTAVGTK